MTAAMNVLLVGDQGTFRAGLAEGLVSAGHRATCLDALTTPDAAGAEYPLVAAPLRIVFTPTELNEFDLLEDDIETGGDSLLATVDFRVKSFLAQVKVALQLLMQAGGGQLWICDFDDSFSYHMKTPSCPIIAQARAGAVRSLAKEYTRMKITINTLFVQPLVDDTTGPMFRQASAALKTYALRYKPNTIGDISNLLLPLLENQRLALSGSMIGTGAGVLQANLTA